MPAPATALRASTRFWMALLGPYPSFSICGRGCGVRASAQQAAGAPAGPTQKLSHEPELQHTQVIPAGAGDTAHDDLGIPITDSNIIIKPKRVAQRNIEHTYVSVSWTAEQFHETIGRAKEEVVLQ